MEEDDDFEALPACGAEDQNSDEDNPRFCLRETGHPDVHLAGNDWSIWYGNEDD